MSISTLVCAIQTLGYLLGFYVSTQDCSIEHIFGVYTAHNEKRGCFGYQHGSLCDWSIGSEVETHVQL